MSGLELKLKDTGTPESRLRRSRNVYELFIEELEKSIKYDFAPKSIALLTDLSAYSDNPQNCMFKGESSIGKTWNAINVTKYFPPEDVWMLGGLSPTSLVYDHGKLECGADYTTVNLVKNITFTKGDPLSEDWVDEMMDEWDDDNPKPAKNKGEHKSERAKYLRQVKKEWKEIPKKYVVDLSHKILLFLEAPHIDTFNRLRPILSHDSWEITYKATDRNAKKRLATRTITLRGWPATIFCTTDLSTMEDLATRSLTATPRETKPKLQAAIKLTARKSSRPWLFDDENGVDYKEYIKNLKNELLDGWTPVVPFSDELAEVTPPLIGRDMRDYKHIDTLIKMMALLHFYTRPKVFAGEKKYLLATTEDFLLVLRLWKDVEMTTQTGLSGEEINVFESLTDLEKNIDYITLKDIVNAYNEEHPKTISGKTAYKYLENLCEVGLVDKHKDDERTKEEGGDSRRNLYRSLGRLKNRISGAWENSLPFFSEKGLEKWFIDVLEHSPENKVRLILFSDGELVNHILRLNPETPEDTDTKKQVIETLFRGEYIYQPKEPETPTVPPEKPQKHSPGENIRFEGLIDSPLQDQMDAVLMQLSFYESTTEELADLLSLPVTAVDKILAILSREGHVYKTVRGGWKKI